VPLLAFVQHQRMIAVEQIFGDLDFWFRRSYF
jgi:hypothetical protein